MATTPKGLSKKTMVDDLPFHLARAALAFRRFNDRTLQAVGLKPQAPGLASVLHTLEEVDACTINSLVVQTHLPNGTLTGLLDTLEHQGCIERLRNPDDGRSWQIRLTKEGRKLCAKLGQRHELVMNEFNAALSQTETAELKRLLARVTDRMRDYRLEHRSPPPSAATEPSTSRTKKKAKHPK